MIVIKAITLGLVLLASHSFANICSGRWNGDQLVNPTDCSSFYVCDYGEPKLFKCLDHLLYDPINRVCNWAYLVTCGQPGTNQHIPILPNPPYYPESQLHPELGQPDVPPQPYPTSPPQYPSDPHQQPIYPPQYPNNPPEYYPSPPEYYPSPPEYYPNPPEYHPNPPEHPSDPHQHPTDTPQNPYTGHPPPIVDVPNVPDYSETDEIFPGLVESHPDVFHCTNPDFYFAPHPRSCEKYFICENYRLHNTQCGEGIYWDYVYNQCDFPEKSFCYSGYTTTTTTTEPPTFVTGVAPEKGDAIVCPHPDIQEFIGHASDCRKYLICIGGIAIPTTCPDHMAWDEDKLQCNEEAYSQCFP